MSTTPTSCTFSSKEDLTKYINDSTQPYYTQCLYDYCIQDTVAWPYSTAQKADGSMNYSVPRVGNNISFILSVSPSCFVQNAPDTAIFLGSFATLLPYITVSTDGSIHVQKSDVDKYLPNLYLFDKTTGPTITHASSTCEDGPCIHYTVDRSSSSDQVFTLDSYTLFKYDLVSNNNVGVVLDDKGQVVNTFVAFQSTFLPPPYSEYDATYKTTNITDVHQFHQHLFTAQGKQILPSDTTIATSDTIIPYYYNDDLSLFVGGTLCNQWFNTLKQDLYVNPAVPLMLCDPPSPTCQNKCPESEECIGIDPKNFRCSKTACSDSTNCTSDEECIHGICVPSTVSNPNSLSLNMMTRYCNSEDGKNNPICDCIVPQMTDTVTGTDRLPKSSQDMRQKYFEALTERNAQCNYPACAPGNYTEPFTNFTSEDPILTSQNGQCDPPTCDAICANVVNIDGHKPVTAKNIRQHISCSNQNNYNIYTESNGAHCYCYGTSKAHTSINPSSISDDTLLNKCSFCPTTTTGSDRNTSQQRMPWYAVILIVATTLSLLLIVWISR